VLVRDSRPPPSYANAVRRAITFAALGTIAAHVRRGFILDGNFEAILDGQSHVKVTAVLERTAVFEYPSALWVGRHLATFDRLTVENPDDLVYYPVKGWTTRMTSAQRERIAKAEVRPKAKTPPFAEASLACPGSSQPADNDLCRTKDDEVAVLCSDCGQVTEIYRQEKSMGCGWFKVAHLVSEVTDVSATSETNA
jgi:hypothetical protein